MSKSSSEQDVVGLEPSGYKHGNNSTRRRMKIEHGRLRKKLCSTIEAKDI